MSLDNWAKSFVNSCLKKRRYRSAEIAQQVANKVKKERGTVLYCYWCRKCGSYHLTHRPPKDTQETRERVF